MLKYITLAHLKELGASSDMLYTFKKHFGDELRVTRENLEKAAAVGIDVFFIARETQPNFMAEFWAFCEKHTKQIDEAMEKIRARFANGNAAEELEAYDREIEPLWDAYEKEVAAFPIECLLRGSV